MIYKRPQTAKFKPHSGHANSLWIRLDAFKLTGQASWGRGAINVEPTGYTFEFLAPKDFIESTVHEWADYDSLLGRAAQKTAETAKAIYEGKGAGATALSSLWEGIKNFSSEAMLQELKRSGTMNMGVYNYRYDSPLYYKGSERRKFDLIFYLVEEGDPSTDVVAPVRLLQTLSAPTKDGEFYGIKPPHVFSIESVPDKSFLYIKHTAIRAVQPTWRGPYIDGIPSSCELLLSFEDMTPLFDTSFGVKVSVTSTGGAENLPAAAQAATKSVIDQAKDTANNIISRGVQTGKEIVGKVVDYGSQGVSAMGGMGRD